MKLRNSAGAILLALGACIVFTLLARAAWAECTWVDPVLEIWFTSSMAFLSAAILFGILWKCVMR